MNILFAFCMLSAAANIVLSSNATASSSRAVPREGGMVGNGGGTVVCRDPKHEIESVTLLDYFEAEKSRGLTIDLDTFPGDWRAKVQGVIDRLGKKSDLRRQLYSLWLSTFDQDSLHLSRVKFSAVPDSEYLALPEDCEFGQAAVQQVPQFAGDFRYFINDELWSRMSEVQKAGLVIHEPVYREALSYGHDNSVFTRYLVAYFSSKQMAQMSVHQFLDLLSRAHFEQTDFSFLHPNGFMLYDPSVLWRGASQRFDEKIEPLRFVGRFVGNLGKCLDQGCKQWLPLWQANEDRGNRVICRGLEAIGVENQPSIFSGLFLDRDLTPEDERNCQTQAHVEENLERLSINFDRGKDLMSYSKLSQEKSSFDLYGVTEVNYQFSETLPQLKSISAFGDGVSFLSHPVERFELSSTSDCRRGAIEFSEVTNRGIGKASLSDFWDTQSKCKAVGAVRGLGGAPGPNQIDFAMSTLNPSASVNLTEDQRFKDSSAVTQLRSSAQPGVTWSCENKAHSCFDYSVAAQASLIDRITLQESAWLDILNSPGQTSSSLHGLRCLVAPGTYELFANFVPTSIKLSDECLVTGAEGGAIRIPAGSLIHFSSLGQME